jgi:hypothetical protein
LYYCLASKVTHFAQTHPPSLALPFLESFDSAVLDVLVSSFGPVGPDLVANPIAMRRLRLPARFNGCGIRANADVSHAAFVGALCQALPQCIDRVVSGGIRLEGFFPRLESWLGRGSFDEANVPQRFAALARAAHEGSALASAYCTSFDAMRAEVAAAAAVLGRSITSGPLAVDIASAGTQPGPDANDRLVVLDKVQHHLTTQREELRFAILKAELTARPLVDFDRLAFCSVDRFSRQIILAPPLRDFVLISEHWFEGIAMYLALPSPICAAEVGSAIQDHSSYTRRYSLDAHGFNLWSVRTLTNKGGIRSIQHDTMVTRIVDSLTTAGAKATQSASHAFGDLVGRLPSGRGNPTSIIPDWFHWDGSSTCRMGELKTLANTPYTYRRALHWREGMTPTRFRESELQREYAAKAAILDNLLEGKPPNSPRTTPGEFTRRLQSLGPVFGVVWGAYAEGSPNVHKLLDFAASLAAKTQWAEMGARNEADARASTRECLFRLWGIAAVRARATAHCAYFRYAFNKYPDLSPSSSRNHTSARATYEAHYYEAATGGLHAHATPLS